MINDWGKILISAIGMLILATVIVYYSIVAIREKTFWRSAFKLTCILAIILFISMVIQKLLFPN